MEIGKILNCSERTVIRWKKQLGEEKLIVPQKKKIPRKRRRRFSDDIFKMIEKLKRDNPARTAVVIRKLLKKKYKEKIPSESTIRKTIRSLGLSAKNENNRQGYVKFERKLPNDLWQIDIAGVQTVGHLGKLYLIAILDDCSRFIVSAQYFTSQHAMYVFQVIRKAFNDYGRPNQLIADNGTQFKNAIGEQNSRYINLLTSLDIKPIFSRPYHPQSKGKIERWFGTVIRSYLGEARFLVKQNPKIQLYEFNQQFDEWVHWYNYTKPHRSLPHKAVPAEKFLKTPNRIFRPVQTIIDWNRWINQLKSRKVSKYNTISFKGESLNIPPGYVGCRVNLLEYETGIEIYHHEMILCSIPKNQLDYNISNKRIIRTIAQSGTIQFQNQVYTIDYKLAGKKVEIREVTDDNLLYIYLDSILIKEVVKKS